MQAWVAEMSAFVKRVDKNHLVTIGEEGFFASDRPEVRSELQWVDRLSQAGVPHMLPVVGAMRQSLNISCCDWGRRPNLEDGHVSVFEGPSRSQS